MDVIVESALSKTELDDFWEEGSSLDPSDLTFGQRPGTRWFCTYDVFVSYQLQSKDDRHTSSPKTLDGFWHFGACSPAMAKQPPSDIATEIRSLLIQEHFDEAEIMAVLQKKIASLAGCPANSLEHRLDELLFRLPSA